MEKSKAEDILGLPHKYKKMDIKKAFQAMKDVYYPTLHEICGTIDKERLHQIIYARQTEGDDFFPCDNKSGVVGAKDRSIYALFILRKFTTLITC